MTSQLGSKSNMAMVLHSKDGERKIEEDIEARYNEVVDILQLLSARAQIDRLKATLGSLQQNAENIKLELVELDRLIQDAESAKMATSDRQTESIRTRHSSSVVGDIRLQKLDAQLHDLRSRESASQSSLVDKNIEIQTCEGSIQQLEATLVKGRKITDYLCRDVTYSSSITVDIGYRMNFLLEELRDVTALVEQVVCEIEGNSMTTGQEASASPLPDLEVESTGKSLEARAEDKVVNGIAEHHKVVSFCPNLEPESTEQWLKVALSEARKWKGEFDRMMAIAQVGRAVRARRIGQEFETTTKSQTQLFFSLVLF
jgi:multidrug efflux pump subunit AcrA (membrane-fusion protein)